MLTAADALALVHAELGEPPITVLEPSVGPRALRKALLHRSVCAQISSLSARRYATTATDSGVPRLVILLRTLTAMAASVVCVSSLRAISLSPMMLLYLNIAFSPRACW
jgi:hypothetical protein